jgi:hypothetical protein
MWNEMSRLIRDMIAVTLTMLLMTTVTAQAQDADAFERQRAEMLDRPRRIILNNDGGDAVMQAREATPEGMLKPRTIGLEDTQVDTIFYCTNRGTFSRHTHRSEVSEVFTGTEGRYQHNITGALIEQGTDPLQVMIDWCRDNDVEVFWSERMNDRHDSALHEAVSAWKRQHPECLMSTIDKPTPHGAWSLVDYSHEAVRDQMLRILEEVCVNYDVDGIEMDYFRHPCFFRTVAWGGQATDEEIATMTGFVRRVRAMTERVGRERGRPILVALRVVDSVPLARAMGLDLETWLSESLVDLVTGSGYFRMNPWPYLVELGRRHNVKVYAGLSDSRVKADTSRFNRRAQDSYRARASQAWQAGVDGIYLFNMFNPHMGMLRDIGDPETLAPLDKTYFATVRGARGRSYGNPDYWVADGRQWQNVPVLTPEGALTVLPGAPHSIPLYIGDDLAALREQGLEPEVACHVAARGGGRLAVQLNGQTLPRESIEDQWLRFPLPEGLLQPGENVFEFSALAADDVTGDEPVEVEWRADALPKMPWRHESFRGDRTFAEVQGDALLVADRGTEPGDYLYFRYPWGAQADSPAEVAAEVKVISGWNNIMINNGVASERVMLYPDHIGTYYSGLRYDIDTTDGYHTYRVVLEGADIQIYVDGELRIDGAGMFTRVANGRNDLAFGAANSPSLGEALWRSVRMSTPGTGHPQLYDLAVTLRFPGEE